MEKITADFLYEIIEEEVTITKYCGNHQHVRIPEIIDGLPVRVIAPEAFAENDGELESVTVPGSVREIGDGAFKFCLGLQELKIEEGLEILGTDVVLVTPITELHIPSTVHTIRNPHELGGLMLHIAEGNPYYFSDGYGLYEKHPEGNKILAVDLRGDRTTYSVAEGTTVIGQGAFCGEEYLEEIWLPESLRIIEEEAFESCRKLKYVHFNEGLTSIGTNAFSYCALTGVVELPSTLEMLGETVFTNTFDWDRYEDALTQICISRENPHFYADSNGLYRVLADGSLELLRYYGVDQIWKMPDNVGRIGSHAFRRSQVKEVTIPETVKEVGEKIFWETGNLLSLKIEQDDTCVYIPRTPIYRKDEVSNLLHKTGDVAYRYDYLAYDELWPTYLYMEDQAGMAIFRLRYPLELSSEKKAFYQDFLDAHLTEVMEDVAAREDRERLVELSQIGYFTSANIDDAIEVLNRCGKTELLGYLMEYKEENIEVDEFDFVL